MPNKYAKVKNAVKGKHTEADLVQFADYKKKKN
jgi:hypothetical protein